MNISSQESRDENAQEYLTRTYLDMCVKSALALGVIDTDRAASLRATAPRKVADLTPITEALTEDVITFCHARDYSKSKASEVLNKVVPSVIQFMVELDRRLK